MLNLKLPDLLKYISKKVISYYSAPSNVTIQNSDTFWLDSYKISYLIF